jgi:hypothetical protein
MAQQKTQHIQEGFAAFDLALAELRRRVENACEAEDEGPARIAAGIRACFAFAIEQPRTARLLTVEALTGGEGSQRRYRAMIAHFARLLRPAREFDFANPDLPAITESAMAGSVAQLIARRLDHGRRGELPTVAAEAVEFVLIPYVGIEEARRLAGERGGPRSASRR